jgi:hypothetical protein
LPSFATNELKIKKPRVAAKLKMADKARAIFAGKHDEGKAASRFACRTHSKTQAIPFEYDISSIIRPF